jgi:hypothetical protein
VWIFGSKADKDMVDRLETLERTVKGLRLEWEDAYDKMRTLTARFVKRAQRIEQHEEEEQQESGSPTGSPTVARTLDPISQRILDRRRRLFGNKEATP